MRAARMCSDNPVARAAAASPRRGVLVLGVLFLSCLAVSASATARGTRGEGRPSISATAYDPPEAPPRFDASSARLEDYLAYAAGQSPALKAAFYAWRSAMEKVEYAGVLPNPSLSYTYFVESVETRVGPQEHVFRLRQSFPWFGTLGARADVSSEAARSAYQKLQSEELRLFYRVKSAYYEHYYIGRDIAITRENLELLTFWESVARARYRVALKQHPDVIKAQVELGKLENRLRTVEDMIAPVVARLRAVMNLPDSIQLPAPREIAIREEPVDRNAVITQVLINNPDLKSMLHLIDKEGAAKRLAAKSSWPGFFVGVDYIRTGEAVMPNVPGSGQDPLMASVGISLPIWFGANRARRQEADARHRKAQYEYQNARNQLTALVETVIFEYKDALRRTRLYRDGLVPKAQQSLNASYTAYQAGEADFLNVLDAQRQLLEFQLQFERSASNMAIRRAEIEMVTGKALPALRND